MAKPNNAGSPVILVADGAQGPIYAAVIRTRFVEPITSGSRLEARLRPFGTAEAARSALETAGGRNVREAGQ